MIEIRGMVRAGKGEGRGFTQLGWVRAQFREKLGFDPYPGTLNVETNGVAPLAAPRAVHGIVIEPAPGFCAARCYRVRVNDRVDAVWIIPDVPGYPPNQVELVAATSLREALMLKDGDPVSIEIK